MLLMLQLFSCWVILRRYLVLTHARAGITEVHFLPFNPTDKRTAFTYTGVRVKCTVIKGAPEQMAIIPYSPQGHGWLRPPIGLVDFSRSIVQVKHPEGPLNGSPPF